MLSTMENVSEIEQHLRAAERASAAPHLNYPPTRWWYAPAIGLWFSALTAVIVLDLHFAVTVGLVVVELVAILRYRRAWGTWAKLDNAPPEIAREIHRYFVGAAIVLAAILVAALTLPAPVPIALALVLVTAGMHTYLQRYERAADATRSRLG